MWSSEEAQVIGELGSEEVKQRIARLANYEKYKVVVRVGETYGHSDAPLNPREAKAFTTLAEALQERYPGGVLVDGLTLVTPISENVLASIVAQREIRDRQAAEAQDA